MNCINDISVELIGGITDVSVDLMCEYSGRYKVVRDSHGGEDTHRIYDADGKLLFCDDSEDIEDSDNIEDNE